MLDHAQLESHILQVSGAHYLGDLVDIRRSYGLTAIDRRNIEERYARELRETDNRRTFLLFDQGTKALAAVQLILKNADKDPELADGRLRAHVHNLRVKKQFQGRGYGKALMIHLEQEARKLGYLILTLGVENQNTRALKMYEKLGYRVFKRTKGRTVGEFVFYMQKTL